MRVLVACEFSGLVRSAFSSRGHYAVSCDYLPTELPGMHYKGDVLNILYEPWDLLIAHPPCTHLAVSGAKHFEAKRASGVQEKALGFVRILLEAPIEKICVENPVSIISTHIRKPNQIIQPWMFGHGEVKTTCLWLKNLPKLKPTAIIPVKWRESKIAYIPPSATRWKERSLTYIGIAEAMAIQWGNCK